MTKIFSNFHAAVTPACRQAGFFCFFSFGGSKRKEKEGFV